MSLNILLVDDSDVIRMMIERTLRLADLPVKSVHHAANGRQALDLLDEEWIDLVLADLNMPVMDGAEMLSRIREQDSLKDMPVIIVSTEGATQRIDDLSSKGVSAWIRKPFTPEEIRDVIGGVTNSWRRRPGIDDALDEVVGAVLETFAFVFPDVADEIIIEIAEETELLRADISFEGAVTGNLSIVAPMSVCADMAANVMGVDIDAEDVAQRAADTLAEIANITAGHLCTRLERHAPTHLLPPVVSRASGVLVPSDLCTTRCYLIDDEPVTIQVAMNAGASGS